MKNVKRLLVGIASAGLCAPLLASPASAYDALPPILPVDHVCNKNYFQPAKGGPMWEITWGRQYDDTGGTPIFKSSSYGGVTKLNGGTVPGYMDPVLKPDFQWWYVTPSMIQNKAKVRLDFDDGTVWHYQVSADENGCPAVEWRSPNGFPDPIPDPDPDPEVPADGSLGSLFGSSSMEGSMSGSLGDSLERIFGS